MSTIWREAFPPPRRLLTTSPGVISLGCKRGFGRRAAFRDFANCFRSEYCSFSGRQIQRVRKSVEDVFALSNPLRALSPIGRAGSTQKITNAASSRSCWCAKDVTRLQAADKKAHPIPPGLLAGQMQSSPPCSGRYT